MYSSIFTTHQVDSGGNLPLHLAAASANLAMIRLLGDQFASGASVRNEDGMLVRDGRKYFAEVAPNALPVLNFVG
jgi:hypothetical protein